MTQVQKCLFSHFHFWIQLKEPNKLLRSKLWKNMIPNETPTDNNIDFDLLTQKFDKFVHRDIERAIIRACGMACLRKNPKDRYLKMDDIVDAATVLENRKEASGLRLGFHHMYT